MTAAPDAGAPPSRVLVTDAEFKHTLGIVRALAGRGHEVHVVATSTRAPSVHSRAVAAWHRAPLSSAPDYDERLLEIATSLAPVGLVPVGSGAMAAAHRLRTRWPDTVRVALPPPESFEIANDKARTAALARAVGVDVPTERLVESHDALEAAWREFGAPLVLKSSREEGRKAVRYVRRAEDLVRAWEEVRRISDAAVMAQPYVQGEGYGFSALYWKGKLERGFVHRRVREWPPSGGTSACAESVPDAPEIVRAGTALLDALAWHGVAMVEFKGEPASGRFSLMEINAKFWGSHDVALAAGVCFPCDLVARLEGETLGPQPPYRRVRFAWPLGGDLWHGLFHPASLLTVLGDALSPRVARSFAWGDPLPHLYELVQWARSTPGAWHEQREMQ